jgi:hypothetical protein
MPYLYIDKLFNELREELLSAMHAAADREIRTGQRVDVNRLYRAFTRAAVGKMANPVRVSDRCLEMAPPRSKKGAGRDTEA